MKNTNLIIKTLKELSVNESLQVINATLSVPKREVKNYTFVFDSNGKLTGIRK